jgi:hypothetical protein
VIVVAITAAIAVHLLVHFSMHPPTAHRARIPSCQHPKPENYEKYSPEYSPEHPIEQSQGV